jgi:hypothetical protein
LNPALLAHVTAALPTRRTRRQSGARNVGCVERLSADAIDRLVAQYVGGTTAAELGQRYDLAKSSVIRLVRDAGERVQHPRLSASETAQLVALYEVRTVTEGHR